MHIKKGHLTEECTKLDPEVEQSLAEEGFSSELEEWPEYQGGDIMVRTQIYLTKQQRDELAAIAKFIGKKQSELIREAIDQLIHQRGVSRRESVLRKSAGIWKDRVDLPNFNEIRTDWNRN
jgi:hypothetical protein